MESVSKDWESASGAGPEGLHFQIPKHDKALSF